MSKIPESNTRKGAFGGNGSKPPAKFSELVKELQSTHTPEQALSILSALEGLVHSLSESTEASIKPIRESVTKLDARVDKLDAKFDAKFDGLSTRVDGLATRVDGLATKFDGFADKINEGTKAVVEASEKKARVFIYAVVGWSLVALGIFAAAFTTILVRLIG